MILGTVAAVVPSASKSAPCENRGGGCVTGSLIWWLTQQSSWPERQTWHTGERAALTENPDWLCVFASGGEALHARVVLLLHGRILIVVDSCDGARLALQQLVVLRLRDGVVRRVESLRGTCAAVYERVHLHSVAHILWLCLPRASNRLPFFEGHGATFAAKVMSGDGRLGVTV
jgi:hypothetical protein